MKAAELSSRQLAAEESWVLGEAATRGSSLAGDQLTTAVRRLYMQDYARIWEEFINDVALRAGNPRDTTRVLSDPVTSPLLLLMQAFVRNTTLSVAETGEKTLVAGCLGHLTGRGRERAATEGAHGRLGGLGTFLELAVVEGPLLDRLVAAADGEQQP